MSIRCLNNSDCKCPFHPVRRAEKMVKVPPKPPHGYSYSNLNEYIDQKIKVEMYKLLGLVWKEQTTPLGREKITRLQRHYTDEKVVVTEERVPHGAATPPKPKVWEVLRLSRSIWGSTIAVWSAGGKDFRYVSLGDPDWEAFTTALGDRNEITIMREVKV